MARKNKRGSGFSNRKKKKVKTKTTTGNTGNNNSGGNNSGGNNSGGNNSGGNNSGGNNSGGKNNKTTKPSKPKPKKLTGLAKLQQLGRAPIKPRDRPAAVRFRDREARGLDGFTGRPKTNFGSGNRPVPGSTAAMVARDNAMYGNTVPAGSFGISEAGRKQAERQKSVQGRTTGFGKTKLPFAGGIFNPLNAFTPEGRMTMLSGYADSAVDGVNFAKNVLTAGYAKDKFNVPKLPKFQDAGMQALRNVSSVALPLAQGAANVARFKTIDPVSGKAGLANEIAKMTTTNKAYKAGIRPALTNTGISNVNVGTFAKAFSPQMVATGPTAGATVALNTAMTGSTVGDKVKAGGLNIGNAARASEGDEGSGDPTARVSGFRSVRPLGIAREALQGFGDMLTGQRTDFDQLGRLGFGATTDKLKDAAKNAKINEVADTLKKSPIRQAYVGFDYGIDVPDALKQYDETKSVLGKTFKDFKGKDIDLGNIKPGSLDKNVMAEDLRGGISNVAYNLDRMPTLARGISAFQTKTEGGGDKEFRKDLRFTFNRKVDAPTGVPGRDLMKATTPGIVNRVLSGKLKDMGQEAITQNNLTGGMTADKFDTIASTLNKNLKTEGTIAKTRMDELTSLAKRFGPGGGQAPTPKSILRGVNPFRRTGGGSGSNIQNRPVGSGTSTPVGQLPQIPNPAEVELPIIPQPQQQGTQAKTLSAIQNQSYQNTFNNLMAQFRPRNINRRRTFRSTFNRDYFSQFV